MTSILARLFSEKSRDIAIALELSVCHAKTLTFLIISVITEDIYLKLGVCVHYPESNPYYQGRSFKMYFFRIMPLFCIRIFIHYQAPHSRALASACSALLMPQY